MVRNVRNGTSAGEEYAASRGRCRASAPPQPPRSLLVLAARHPHHSATRRSQYFRGASAAALVYDTTTADSLAGAQRWLKEVKAELDDVVVVLVGSKCDLVDKRQVDFAKAAEVAAAEGAEHIECSAKDGTNVEAVRVLP